MPNTFNSNTFASTYKDDFLDSDNFHRILFNSGKALQARELTQMQTIIQEEMGRLGRFFFKEGAAVEPGGFGVSNPEFIKLNTSVNTLPANPNDLVGVELTSDGGIKVEVQEVLTATASDPATLFVKYTDTSSGTAGATTIRVAQGEDLSGGGYTLTIGSTGTGQTAPIVGRGSKFHNAEGVFFAKDHFVYAPPQSITVAKYSQTPDADLGFLVTEDIVTVDDDDGLYDNQGATPNRSSPGADRYRIRLTLINMADVDSDQNSIEIANMRNGLIEAQIEAEDDLAVIGDILATRTKEESGNYIAKPFQLSFDTDSADTSILNFNVTPGLAYVNGYRAETELFTEVPVLKPRTTVTENNEVSAANFGNYVLALGEDSAGGRNSYGLPNISQFEQFNLRNQVHYGGSTIGTARIKAIEEDTGGNYRLYLFDVQMNAGQAFRRIRSLGTSGTNYFNVDTTGGVKRFDTTVDLDNLIFDLPVTRPRALTDISLTVQRFGSFTATGSVATLTLTAADETFANTTDWIVADSAINTGLAIAGAGTQSATITGVAPGATVDVAYYVNKSNATVRTKTLNTAVTETITPGSDEIVQFSNVDIFKVNSIEDSSGNDISDRYIIDNGQRDDYYARGRLRLRGGAQARGSRAVSVDYDHFSHGAAGSFFAVNSYTGQVNYEDIPSYTYRDGTTVNLRDVLDFRSSVNSSGTFGSGARINEIPQNTDLITTDVEYYLPKNAILVIDTDGVLSVREGQPNLQPQFPSISPDELELFRVQMNPYTVNDSDLVSTRIDAKRYTMADIGRLEKRIDNLEELTSLSLLELDTQAFSVLDSADNTRFKSGIFVDNFADHQRSLTTGIDYRAAIDPQGKVMKPRAIEKNVPLAYDSSQSSNVILKGDNVYLNYTHVSYINQPLASSAINVNPFSVVQGKGKIKLSPASDTWKEIRYNPDRTVSGGTKIRQSDRLLANQQIWNWAGTSINDINVNGVVVGQTLAQQTNNTGDTQTTGSISVASIETTRELISDRVVSRVSIPFMRSIKVFFKAQGLRPNTRYFGFFNKKPVASWLREEAFQSVASNVVDYGDQYANATAHPDGATNLISDTNGTITGSFFIPSTDSTKFRTGEAEFSLLDVSAYDLTEAISQASTTFISSGVLETRQRTFLSTRHVTLTGSGTSRRVSTPDGSGQAEPGPDPLAQTFFVTERTGIFATKIDIFFETKASDGVPAFVELRPVVNGYPSATETYPGSTVFLAPSSITTSTDASVATTFEFDEPIYLPNGEHCIVIGSDSNAYKAYIAETYAFVLGTTERRVNSQPTLGSLFKSQNARTWEADQTKDLTFQLYRADFDTAGGYAIIENVDLAPTLLAGRTQFGGLLNNPLTTTNGSAVVQVKHPNHGLFVGNTVTIAGATATGGISAGNLNGNRTIVAIDGTGYTFTAGASATSDAVGGGTAITASHQAQGDMALPFIGEPLLPILTDLTYEAKFTSGRSYAHSGGSLQVPYVKDTTYRNIQDKSLIRFNSPKVIATATNETSELGAGIRSNTYKVSFSTTNSKVSPVLDMQRASVTMINNIIDRPAAAAVAGSFNEPLDTFVAETDPDDGSALAKHLTNVIGLEESAKGLKILLGATRPNEAEIEVYYRTNAEGDINEASFTEVTVEGVQPASDETGFRFREYEYLAGGLGGTLDDFTEFQVKVVMLSTNSSKVPVIRDLRVIALAV